MDDVPPRPRRSGSAEENRTASDSSSSTTRKKSAAETTISSTIPVEMVVSLRVGHVTLEASGGLPDELRYVGLRHRPLCDLAGAAGSEPATCGLETAALPAELYPSVPDGLRRVPGYSMILATTPAPTVLPPSRMAKRSPSSMAIGWISCTSIEMLSPGITISVPSGSRTVPVTSVVRK